jgi:hypothetical protein
MKYKLNDWAGKAHTVKIPDGTTEVAGVVVSGDEILVYPVFRDPMQYDRINDNLEGSFHKRLVDGLWIDKEE